ncbi:hypothetical protein [Bordetella sp. BOR01]|uniref:hypothetical protein n=1 Tax=Bordetella sp. BOR01 TaxID=2854779 RepID=UPI001C4779DE|nr:hypothetical protein [Bordetella sp. BOR01]MBV7482432.1 hypothetical protein [Bordetella sp. BOR01]
MKTQISFKKTDGSDGTALVNGAISSTLEAKRALANALDLPAVDAPSAGQEDVDSRLRNGGIDPDSIAQHHISE